MASPRLLRPPGPSRLITLPLLRHAFSTASTPPSSSSSSLGGVMRQRCPPKTIHDHLTPMQATQFNTLLHDILPRVEPPAPRSPISHLILPPAAHLAYFPPLMAASDLAPDGADAAHVPPDFHLATPEDPAGGRRLWAGGEVLFRHGWEERLRLDGRPVVGTEEMVSATDVSKDGSKYLVNLERSYALGQSQDTPEITEKRILCFIKDPPTDKSRMIRLKSEPTKSHTFTLTPTHLFHFSALTYNAHFIHLDRTTALAHGPLTLALMLRVLCSSRHFSTIKKFTYKNLAPLLVGQTARVCIRDPAPREQKDQLPKTCDIWVETQDGGLIARGKADMYDE